MITEYGNRLAEPVSLHLKREQRKYNGRVLLALSDSPVPDFLQTITPSMFKKPHSVAGMLELVNIRPDFGLPPMFVSRGFAAARAPGMKVRAVLCGACFR